MSRAAAYEIVEATAEHVRALGGRLRVDDAVEITATGDKPRAALWHSWRGSALRRAVLIDGRPAALWGVHGDLMGAHGIPWFLTAPEIERIPVAMVREGRREIQAMLRIYPHLNNYVLASYCRAVRFVGLLGFSLGQPVMVRGAAFRPFWIDAGVNLEESPVMEAA